MKTPTDQDLLLLVGEALETSVNVSTSLKRDDIEAWDSLGHLQVVEAIEKTFQLSLTLDEIMEIDGIESMKTVLIRHKIM